MTENNRTSHTDAQTGPQAEPQVEPTLRGLLEQPKGVLQKNLKTFIYLGAALLVIVAALFSSSGKKTPAQQAAAKGQPPQPTLQDNTDNNVQDLKNQVQAERQKEQQAATAPPLRKTRRLRLRRSRSRPPPRPSAQAARRPLPAFLAGPAGKRSKAPCRRNLLPSSNRRSSLPRRSVNGLTTPVSLPTLCTPVLPSNSNSSRKQQGQIVPAQYDHTERQAKTSLVTPRAEGEQEETPGGYKRPAGSQH